MAVLVIEKQDLKHNIKQIKEYSFSIICLSRQYINKKALDFKIGKGFLIGLFSLIY